MVYLSSRSDAGFHFVQIMMMNYSLLPGSWNPLGLTRTVEMLTHLILNPFAHLNRQNFLSLNHSILRCLPAHRFDLLSCLLGYFSCSCIDPAPNFCEPIYSLFLEFVAVLFLSRLFWQLDLHWLSASLHKLLPVLVSFFILQGLVPAVVAVALLVPLRDKFVCMPLASYIS